MNNEDYLFYWICLDKGAPLSLVKETLGHSSIAITEKYLHLLPDDFSSMYLF